MPGIGTALGHVFGRSEITVVSQGRTFYFKDRGQRSAAESVGDWMYHNRPEWENHQDDADKQKSILEN